MGAYTSTNFQTIVWLPAISSLIMRYFVYEYYEP